MGEARDGSRPLSILYVAGTGRSGSTLLDLMLGSIPGVLSLGEFWRVWLLIWENNWFCGCGEPLRECPFWREAIGRAFGGLEGTPGVRHREAEAPLRSRRALPQVAFPALLGRRRAAYDAAMEARLQLYRAAAETAGAKLLVDSSKSPSYAHALRRMPGVRVRTVHLVRDSRAVAFSWSRVKPYPRPDHPENTMRRFKPGMASMLWDTEQATVECLVRPVMPTLRIYYEDLCREPVATARRILRFAGFPALGDAFDPDLVRAAPNHTVGGNPVRVGQGRLAVRADDEWRRAMAPGARRKVTAMTWPLLAAYGYTGPRRRRDAS